MTNLEKYDELTARIRERLACIENCDSCSYEYHRCFSQVMRDIRSLNDLVMKIDLANFTYGKETYK